MKRAADSVVFFWRLNRSSCSLEGTTVLEKPNRERTFIKKFHYTVAAAALHKTGREFICKKTTFPSLYIHFSSFQRKSVEVRFELNNPPSRPPTTTTTTVVLLRPTRGDSDAEPTWIGFGFGVYSVYRS